MDQYPQATFIRPIKSKAIRIIDPESQIRQPAAGPFAQTPASSHSFPALVQPPTKVSGAKPPPSSANGISKSSFHTKCPFPAEFPELRPFASETFNPSSAPDMPRENNVDLNFPT
jgi:hypothetical protein